MLVCSIIITSLIQIFHLTPSISVSHTGEIVVIFTASQGFSLSVATLSFHMVSFLLCVLYAVNVSSLMLDVLQVM